MYQNIGLFGTLQSIPQHGFRQAAGNGPALRGKQHHATFAK